MSEVVTVHEKSPQLLKSINWAVVVPIVLAIVNACGIDLSSISGYIPDNMLPGAAATAAAVVIVKVAKWVWYKWIKPARKVMLESDGKATVIPEMDNGIN